VTLKQRLLSLEAAARGRHDSKVIPAGLGDFAPGEDFERRARDFSRRVNGGDASAEEMCRDTRCDPKALVAEILAGRPMAKRAAGRVPQ
jgi:hypothetical protein